MGDILKWFGEITPGGVGIWACVGMIAVALIRQKPITQRLQDAREGNLLKERAADMRGMRRRITELEAEQRVANHTISNLEQVIEMFLTLTENEPEKAVKWAAVARTKLGESKALRATEKAGIYAASIVNSDADEEPAE